MLYIRLFMHLGILASFALGACVTAQGSAPSNDANDSSQIRSAEDLERYLKAESSSPLDHLSPHAKQQFIDNLVFTPYGLGSYRHSDLDGLSATEIHQILRLFGAERTTSMIASARVVSELDREIMSTQQRNPRDHYSYKCSGPSTCMSAVNFICLSTCSTP